MASDVERVVKLFQMRETQEAFGEWIVQLARKIHEKPEEVVWFFREMRRREERDKKLEEFERVLKDTSPEELFELAVGEAESAPEIGESTEKLLAEAGRKIEKFRRIERKLKRAGVI